MNPIYAFQVFEILDFIDQYRKTTNENFPSWFEHWNDEFSLVGAN